VSRRPALREESTAWDLRTYWANRQAVRLTLTPECLLRTIVGTVDKVSATGAFVEVDGWHIPTACVDAIGKPTYDDKEAYKRQMEAPHIQQALNPQAERAA
jgi:hypothetical protein